MYVLGFDEDFRSSNFKKKISSSSPEISNFECFSLTKNRDSKKSKKKNVEKSKFQVPSLMSE